MITQQTTSLPHITASAVIEDNGKFLLVEERADNEIVINQPSGHVEPKESPIDASIRETLEETGHHYQPTAIVGFYFYHSDQANITYQRICFTGKLLDKATEEITESNIIQPLWLTIDEIKQHSAQLRSPLVLQCIEDYMSGKTYSLDTVTCLWQ